MAMPVSGVAIHTGERFSLDHRVVVIGSMLPDIIDKPLALLIAPDLVNHSTRNFGHTAWLGLVIIAVGFWWLHRTGGFAVLTLGLASTGHLVFDQMWKIHETLLWPFFGAQFQYPVGDVSTWFRTLVSQLYTSPPELIGALSFIFLAYRVVRARAVSSFFRAGRIP